MNTDLIAKIISNLSDVEINVLLTKFQGHKVINVNLIRLAHSHLVNNFIDNRTLLDDVILNHKRYEQSVASMIHLFKSADLIKDHFFIICHTSNVEIVTFLINDIVNNNDKANFLLNNILAYKSKQYVIVNDILLSVKIYQCLVYILKHIETIFETVHWRILNDILDIIKTVGRIELIADLCYVYYNDIFDLVSQTKSSSNKCMNIIVKFCFQEGIIALLQSTIYKRYVRDSIDISSNDNHCSQDIVEGKEIIKYINVLIKKIYS
jgi:hypothetical protein